MAFRAYDEIEKGNESALRYLIPSDGNSELRKKAKAKVLEILDEYGPVIDRYPIWHPILGKKIIRQNEAFPSVQDKHIYDGLNHTILFSHGFITCPHTASEKHTKVINSVASITQDSSLVKIVAEEIDIPLYRKGTTPILVKCEWKSADSLEDGLIRKKIAIALMLESQIPCWRFSEVAETWETMRGYLLGEPNGARSSLFVNQETGQAMKNTWNAIIKTGIFGPIYV